MRECRCRVQGGVRVMGETGTVGQLRASLERQALEAARECMGSTPETALSLVRLANEARAGATIPTRVAPAQSAERVAALEDAWSLTRGMFEDLAENGNGADAVFADTETAARVFKALEGAKEPKR